MNRQKILVSKITIPDIRAYYEKRGKLLSELQAAEGKLLILGATIGYGKTVLMSQFARLPGHVCAWYHLDFLDNDLATFVRYLIQSLDRALGDFELDEEVCFESKSNNLNKLSRRLILKLEDRLENMKEQRFMLALDNFQVLVNPEIFQLLEELLNYIGHRFLLVAATRGAVPDSFAKYFMRHQGTMFGADRLSFREAEVHSILNRILHGEDAEQYAEMIWRNTEGWPAGVMLAALYLRRIGACALDVNWERISRESWVQNYITYELYKGLSYDIQRFLLRTSFAEELHPKLCDHICGIQNADDILQYLLRENLFLLRMTGTNGGYRYHPAFRSFLISRAGEELKRSMCGKIANYYLKLRDDANAAKYAAMADKTAKKDGQQLLQVSCFGKFRVVILETGKEISWRTRKALELFAYLVDLEGRPVERRVLLEQLWPDDAPDNEVAMLHNMIYSIRKELSSQPELKNLIQYKGRKYYLDLSRISVDLDSKKQICELTEMGKARELYERRDELLNHWGVYLREVDGTWCMSRRAYFERTYGKACSILADYCRKKGDLETEVACWSAYMAADRYSEEAVAGLLRCYADLGERHQMQCVFETAKRIFQEEMGMELSPEILMIYEQGLKKRKK
ncbi:MAG: winged helix-turn-helix domain-containing protein [Acetatifactor sp.]|nr:winged helix-turn-helix domain-containing protein [Acetatifactor sp.]